LMGREGKKGHLKRRQISGTKRGEGSQLRGRRRKNKKRNRKNNEKFKARKGREENYRPGRDTCGRDNRNRGEINKEGREKNRNLRRMKNL